MNHEHEVRDLLIHEPELRRVALNSTRNAADAEDVLQDMWLAVLKKKPREVTSERAWLGRIIRNLSASRARSESARRRREKDRADSGLGEPTEAVVERTALRKHLLECVLELEPAYRRVLLLRYVADMEPADIADYLGMPASTVRVHCHRGLEVLRRRLGTDDPRRHRTLLLLMAPGLLPRKVPRFAFGLAAACLVITCTVFGLRASSEASPTLENDLAEFTRATPVLPRRTSDRQAGETVVVEKTEEVKVSPSPTGARLTGTVDVLVDEKPIETDITLAVEFFRDESESHHPLAGAHNDEDWLCGAPDVTFNVRAGTPFAVPLEHHALLRVFIRASGVSGGLIVYHSSRVPLERTVRLLSGVTLTAPHGRKPTARAPIGTHDEVLPVTARGEGTWHVAGPLFPGLQVTLDESEPSFWRRITEPVASLSPIGRVGARSVRLIDAAANEPLAHTKIDVTTWTRDHRVLSATWTADVDGVVRIPLLSFPDRALGNQLWVRDARGRGWCVEPLSELLEVVARPSDCIDLLIGRNLEGGGTLVDASKSPLRDAQVSARLADGSVLAGRTDEDGRFTLTSVGGRPRPRRIARTVVAIGDAPHPPAVSLEITSTSGHATLRDIPWIVLARGEARLSCTLESAEAPPTRSVRVVDGDGLPLSLIRVAIAYSDGRTVHRDVTDHDGKIVFPDLFPERPVVVRVLAPERRPSLSSTTRISGQVREATIETVRIRDVTLEGSAFVDTSFVAVIVEDEERKHRRHGFFSDTAMRSIPLSDEPQRVTVYAPGRLAESTTWNPRDAVLHLGHRAAGDVAVVLPSRLESARGTFSLHALRLGHDARHEGPLERVLEQFNVNGTIGGDGILRFSAVPPGEWSLRLDGQQVGHFTLHGAGPHDIDLAN